MTDTTNAPLTQQASEAIMKICKCGCGEEISALNKWKWEYKRGHKPTGAKKSKADRKPRTAPETEAAETEVVEELVAMQLNEFQLNRIWDSLPIEEKALAIVSALEAERA